MSDEEYCKNCKFSYKMTYKDLYLCRRYPPTVVGYVSDGGHDTNSHTEYPQVGTTNWCGEYKAQESSYEDEE